MRKLFNFVVSVLVILSLCCNSSSVALAASVGGDEDALEETPPGVWKSIGDEYIQSKTTAKAATNNIRWRAKEMVFTLRQVPNGDIRLAGSCGEIYRIDLTRDGSECDTSSEVRNGIATTTRTIDSNLIINKIKNDNKVLESSDLIVEGPEGVPSIPIYTNVSYQVYSNNTGEQIGEICYTAEAINAAQSWDILESVQQYTNKSFHWNVPNGDVEVLYVNEEGETVGSDSPREYPVGNSKDIEVQPPSDGYELTGDVGFYTRETTPRRAEGCSFEDGVCHFTVPVGGLLIKVYVREKVVEEIEAQYTFGRSLEKATGNLVLASKDFTVTDAIPVSEKLYTETNGVKAWRTGYNFIKFEGEKVVSVKVNYEYTESWEEADPNDPIYEVDPVTGEKTKTIIGYNTIMRYETYSRAYSVGVKRPYLYYKIDNFTLYTLKDLVVNNKALPSGKLTLSPTGYSAPSANAVVHGTNFKPPEGVSDSYAITVDAGNVGESPMSYSEAKSLAESAVGKMQCRNDRLDFNGTTYMNDAWTAGVAKAPTSIPECTTFISSSVFSAKNIVIPDSVINGSYSTTNTLTYKKASVSCSSSGSDKTTSSLKATYKTVKVHTPVVSHLITFLPERTYNQSARRFSRGDCVFTAPDSFFKTEMTQSGQHLSYKGYGDRDYSAYAKDAYFVLPFDVYEVNASGVRTFKKKGTHLNVTSRYYVPSWVTPGDYVANFYVVARNAPSSVNFQSGSNFLSANLAGNCHGATTSIPIYVGGRVFGLSLYSNSDPYWKSLFEGDRKTAMYSYNRFSVGTMDRNGLPFTGKAKTSAAGTLPTLNGDNPVLRNEGIVKPGYAVRFALSTIGDYTSNEQDKCYVKIEPTYYYVDAKGKNRQEVDIYYAETINKSLLLQ